MAPARRARNSQQIANSAKRTGLRGNKISDMKPTLDGFSPNGACSAEKSRIRNAPSSRIVRKKDHIFTLGIEEEFQTEVILLHVIEPEVPPVFDGFMIAPPVISTIPDGARKLTRLAGSVQTARISSLKSTIRLGLPAHEIVEAAKELDIDLVIIATHGYTGWKHFAIGSTAERVVRTAPCPVLVVREREHEFV